jgi:hypothetical protein
MRRPANAVFLPAIVLSGAICGAQVPSQFKGLLTTTTDYTCAGVVPCATWPMPDLPQAGGSYTDPTWGTTTYRLAVPPENHGTAFTTYSRVQAWNSDNTKMFLSEAPGTAYLDLYDATTTPPTPINRITTTDNTYVDSENGDALWANSDSNRIYYVPWAANATNGLQLRYIDVSKCTTSNCQLKPVIVHSFSCKTDATSSLGAGVPGNVIETGSGGQGSMFDSTDRYFSFSCDNTNEAGRTEIDFVRYDRILDKVTTQVKWYTVCAGGEPKGCEVFKECPRGGGKCDTNMFRMNQHPDANYITILWQCAITVNSAWKIGCGTAAYGPTYNFLGPISAENYHQDNGFDVNGIPTWVGIGAPTGTVSDYYSVEVVNLTTLSASGITSKQLQLPCSYAYAGAGCAHPYLGAKSEHISMTGTWGSTPGYALFSTLTSSGENAAIDVDRPLATTLGTAVSRPRVATVTPGSMASIGVGTQQLIDFGSANIETVTVTGTTSTTFTATFAKTHTPGALVSNLTAGDTGPYAMENIAVKIDTKAPSGSTAKIWRLGRTMSIRDGDYGAEPHTAVNRDFTQFTWGSNWNVDGGRVYGFWTKLPAATSKAAGASASPRSKPE